MRGTDNSFQSDFDDFHLPFDSTPIADNLARDTETNDPGEDLPHDTPTATRGK